MHGNKYIYRITRLNQKYLSMMNVTPVMMIKGIIMRSLNIGEIKTVVQNTTPSIIQTG